MQCNNIALLLPYDSRKAWSIKKICAAMGIDEDMALETIEIERVLGLPICQTANGCYYLPNTAECRQLVSRIRKRMNEVITHETKS